MIWSIFKETKKQTRYFKNQGRLPTETSDSELASDMEPIQPSLQQSLPAEMRVREGDQVRMDCVIVAQPEPEVINHSSTINQLNFKSIHLLKLQEKN